MGEFSTGRKNGKIKGRFQGKKRRNMGLLLVKKFLLDKLF
jgi:hypothetical protein